MTADTNNINYISSGEAVNTASDYEIEVEKIPLTRIPLTELYLRAEEKIKATGGMKITEQVMKELKEEARVDYSKTVQKLAEEEPDIGLVPPTNEEMRPHVRRVDRALAAHIKRARKLYCSGGANKMIDDAQFYEMFRLANHSPDEPKEEFYSMVEDLKRKKLL
ncbi:MAG: hypothetical protein K0S84_1368 [Nitrososphaera sp.]|nr:hypothetical protein [Nitrososphaera sp.]